MKLRTEVSIFLVTVVISTTSLVGYSLYQKYSELNLKLTVKFISDNQQAIKNNIENFLHEKMSDVKLISRQEYIKSKSNKQILKELIKIRNNYKNYEAFEVVDSNGKTLIHTSQLHLGEVTPAIALIKQVVLKNKFQLELAIDELSHKGEIKIAVPIYNNNSQIDRFIIAYIPIHKAYNEISLAQAEVLNYLNPKMELRTNDNKIIYQNHYEQNQFNFPLAQLLEQNNNVNFYNGKKNIYIYTHFNLVPKNKNFSWTLVSKISKSDMMEPINSLISKIFLGGFFLIGLILFISHILLSKLLVPLEELSSSMKLLGAGKFEKLKPSSSGSLEFKELIKGFNFMIENLQKSIAEANINSKFASMGEMSSGIAHEINNPLTIIKGLSHMTPRLLETNQKNRILENSQKIEATVDRIAKIIKSLRAYSRDESQEPPKKESLNQIMDSTMDLCFEKITNKGVKIEVQIPENDTFVLARAFQVSQILINLLDNATDELMKTDQKWILMKALIKNNSLEISVENGGPKISAEIADKLFTPFFTTKEVGKGTGLGLALSLKLARSNLGDLKLDTSGDYTKFVLTLPLAKNEEKNNAA